MGHMAYAVCIYTLYEYIVGWLDFLHRNDETVGSCHRRRIYLEDKAKFVASDWGTESLPR